MAVAWCPADRAAPRQCESVWPAETVESVLAERPSPAAELRDADHGGFPERHRIRAGALARKSGSERLVGALSQPRANSGRGERSQFYTLRVPVPELLRDHDEATFSTPMTSDSPMPEVWPGKPLPLGAHWDGRGTNFSVFSEVATRVYLCLFDADGKETRIRLPEVTAFCWHGYLPGIGRGSDMVSESKVPGHPPTDTGAIRTSCCSIPTRVRSPTRCSGKQRCFLTCSAIRMLPVTRTARHTCRAPSWSMRGSTGVPMLPRGGRCTRASSTRCTRRGLRRRCRTSPNTSAAPTQVWHIPPPSCP